ncbi:hypothetical protein TPHA_0I01160 [Tetrapisispora phaffii CBS 4417]|uniref:Translocon Sec61/SecY plug domain-containing protein n=1 Tax=Tetrapisispora phaffii (strain ATCC 24235 / CBS 4417 / NBRC 1672 / NRRL Y-8282 / UCD 70-5) TaxID=1071381 RepID=G8BXJ4_TETPH|nr:hypothetical protein TPHA_0I01160 [Tetrapisispora phaffii CBS 4417]CCE64622.1 hypothetical protein TPHA_0I01160 [Tetrapisispora phaffii CBS 4417]
MANFSLIDTVKPFLPVLPEIELPYEKLEFDDKIVYTIASGLIYLFSQFPLAGIPKDSETGKILTNVKDPIFFLRGVFAAEPNTLLEFGIFPIVSTSIILQLLAGLKCIRVNFTVEKERETFQSFSKLLIIIQYFILANIFIFSGYYGDNLPIVSIVLLNLQLVGAGIFATLLVEIIDKGFGFASGVMSINTLVVSTNLIADMFGVASIKINEESDVTESQGSVIYFLNAFRAKHLTIVQGIVNAFQRDYLPNLTSSVIVLAIAAVVGYLFSCTLELPVRSTRARAMQNVYPIRLIYVGALSIYFSYSLLFYIHIAAFALIQIVAKNDTSNILAKVLGHYEIFNNILYVPSFPLSLLAPPRSFFAGIVEQPLTFITFTAFMVYTGMWFAHKWQRISGDSANDLAEQFKDQGITLAGRREQNIAKELEKVIPVAATTGAVVLALVTVAGEYLGLKGKAAAAVVGVAGGFSLLEIISLEYQQTGGQSALTQVLGVPSTF